MVDRHQFRADWHDYNGGIYFVTICCAEKRHLLGEISPDDVGAARFIASALGIIVEQDIRALPSYHNDLEVWNFVVMPNHIHMVLAINPAKSQQCLPVNMGCLKKPQHGEAANDFHHNSRLATIIGSFKAGITRKFRATAYAAVGTRFIASSAHKTPLSSNTTKIWQPRYYEHIIRDQRAFDNIMNYVDSNIEKWASDRFNEITLDNV